MENYILWPLLQARNHHAHLTHPHATPTWHTHLPHTLVMPHWTNQSSSRVYQVGVTDGIGRWVWPTSHAQLPRPPSTLTCHAHLPHPPATPTTTPNCYTLQPLPLVLWLMCVVGGCGWWVWQVGVVGGCGSWAWQVGYTHLPIPSVTLTWYTLEPLWSILSLLCARFHYNFSQGF